MRAVMATRLGAPLAADIAELHEPSADSDEVLIRVKAFSLNRGEVRRAATQAAGTMIGWAPPQTVSARGLSRRTSAMSAATISE